MVPESILSRKKRGSSAGSSEGRGVGVVSENRATGGGGVGRRRRSGAGGAGRRGRRAIPATVGRAPDASGRGGRRRRSGHRPGARRGRGPLAGRTPARRRPRR